MYNTRPLIAFPVTKLIAQLIETWTHHRENVASVATYNLCGSIKPRELSETY